MVDWVQCDICEEWFHTFGVGIDASRAEYIREFCA